MKLPSIKIFAPTLAITAVILISGIVLALHMTRAPRPTKPTTNTTATTTASPAQLAADEAAYKASAALMTQLCNTSDQDKQAEQTALDTYGDTSTQYQTAKATADKACNACSIQTTDTASKSLQMTTDGGILRN